MSVSADWPAVSPACAAGAAWAPARTRIAENRVASSARARLTVVVMGSPGVKERGDGRAAWLDSHLGVRCSQYLECMGRTHKPTETKEVLRTPRQASAGPLFHRGRAPLLRAPLLGDEEALDVDKLIHTQRAQFAAETGVLHAAEGQLSASCLRNVDVDHAGVNATRDLLRALFVF